MKRDLDLIRTLMQRIESAPTQQTMHLSGLNLFEPRVQYHLRLLVEAKLARCVGVASDGGVCLRLTWQGHELLEISRNDRLWERAKQLVQSHTGGLSAIALQALLNEWAVTGLAEAERLQFAPPEKPSRLAFQSEPVSRFHTNGNGNGHGKGNGNGNGHVAKPVAAPVVHHRTPPAQITTWVHSPWYGKHDDPLPIHML